MAEFDWREWTDWHSVPLQHNFGFVDAPSKPGAYMVATNAPLTRAVGVDNHGILTIGESDDLHERVFNFANCALMHGTEGHMAGWRFSFFRFEKYFPFKDLRIRWKTTQTKDEANELEGRLLLKYLSEHLELPPLNYKFNWSPFKKEGWDLFDIMIGLKEPPKELPLDDPSALPK